MDKIAKDYGKYEFKEQLLMLGRQYTLLSFMDVVSRWCDASGFPYRQDNYKTNNVEIYTIRFNMATKWSVFFGKFVQHIGEHFNVRNSEVEVTNNTVVFKFQR
jgi:hypothetical protein